MTDVHNLKIDEASILASDISRKNLASRARHDLLQPLAAMKMLLARVGDDITSSERELLLETFKAAVEGIEGSLEKVVQHLFFSNEAVKKNNVRIDLDNWLAMICDPYFEKMTAAGLEFSVECDVGKVDIDDNLLGIVITSGLDNAYDFTTKGSVSITVERNHDTIRVMIQDTGIGVGSAGLERLASPFYVENAEQSRSQTRLGLGLTNACDAASLLGATIDVTPQSTGGSLFVLEF